MNAPMSLTSVHADRHSALARVGLAWAGLGALVSAVGAQEVVVVQSTDQAGARFGFSVASIGDQNSDGIPDYAVGAPDYQGAAGAESGAVFVYSGADHVLLRRIEGIVAGEGFGWSISRLGDIDGDGLDEMAVGANTHTATRANQGRAAIVSPATGLTLQSFLGDEGNDIFGDTVVGVGDLDGDGTNDLAVSAPLANPSGGNSGLVRVFSGADGTVLFNWPGANPADFTGDGLGSAGDFDGDGTPDVVIGAPLFGPSITQAGQVTVRSGATGAILFQEDGPAGNGRLGARVIGVGDVNQDGFDDIAATSPREAPNLVGQVSVYAGPTGTLLYRVPGRLPFRALGESIALVEDYDGDGVRDILVGQLNTTTGQEPQFDSAWIVSAVDGTVITIIDDAPGPDQFGRSVGSLGDLDGDGLNEFAVGAEAQSVGGIASGTLTIYRSGAAVGTTYCAPAVPNSTGQSGRTRALGFNRVGVGYLSLEASQLPPGRAGYFLNSMTQGNQVSPGGSQGVLCLAGAIGRYAGNVFIASPAGVGRLDLDLGATPTPNGLVAIQAGQTWNFTSWYRDVNPSQTSNFSDGVSVTLQP